MSKKRERCAWGTLEFPLPEEREEHDTAVHAMDWKMVVLDMDNFLRGKLKYGHGYESVDEALEKARDELRGFIHDRGVTLE